MSSRGWPVCGAKPNKQASKEWSDRRSANAAGSTQVAAAVTPNAVADQKHSGDNHDGSGRSSPYGLSRLAPQMTLVDVAQEIARADQAIGLATSGKLRLIAEQIRHLQSQAQEIMQAAQRDLRLHRASCAFERVPGQIYHLYEKANGSCVWSILSSEDWGGSPPHTFCGSYRLELDQSWTPVDEIHSHDGDDGLVADDVVQRLLSEASS